MEQVLPEIVELVSLLLEQVRLLGPAGDTGCPGASRGTAIVILLLKKL